MPHLGRALVHLPDIFTASRDGLGCRTESADGGRVATGPGGLADAETRPLSLPRDQVALELTAANLRLALLDGSLTARFELGAAIGRYLTDRED